MRYLSHPQVLIDRGQEIGRWSLNSVGAARVDALAKTGALVGTTRIISSNETKAIETAGPLAASLGLEPEIRPLMHENDRSATGFLPPQEFEAVADRFFAHPSISIRGWETAVAAQCRIVAEVNEALSLDTIGDVLIVGHGGVGTLLYCALMNVPIDRKYDQGPGGGGCYFSFTVADRKPHFGWRPMESMLEGNV